MACVTFAGDYTVPYSNIFGSMGNLGVQETTTGNSIGGMLSQIMLPNQTSSYPQYQYYQSYPVQVATPVVASRVKTSKEMTDLEWLDFRVAEMCVEL